MEYILLEHVMWKYVKNIKGAAVKNVICNKA